MVTGWGGYYSLERAAGTLRALSRYVDGRRAYRLLKELTLYHRIQGSRGVLEAARMVEEYLIDYLPDSVEVDEFTYTGRAMPEWMKLPVHWNLEYAELRLEGYTADSRRRPTLAAAHTPPSDGWVEAEIVRVEDPLDPSVYEKNKDKALLVLKHHSIAYRLAAEAGVPIVVLAGQDRYRDAHPYYGLFLTPEEAERYTTVAVTLPWRVASGAEGKTIRVYVDADIGGPGRVPVVTAWLGPRDEPGPIVFAHLCHPAPGANDNASGVASAVEAFLALAEAVDTGALEEPGRTVRLVLTPEYTGSTLSMEGWLGPLAREMVNLDMVGRRPGLAEEPRILYSPITWGPSRAASAYWDASLATGRPAAIDYYMAGSDHDVGLAYGVDSFMVNQWPDPYYHSDYDDADTISPDLLGQTALRAATTLHLLSTGYEPTRGAPEAAVYSVVSRHLEAGDYESARLAASLLARRYGVTPQARPSWRPPRDDRVIRRRIPVLLSPLLVEAGRSLDEALDFYKRLTDIPGAKQTLMREIFYAAMNGYTVSRYMAEMAAAYGVEKADPERLSRGLEILEEYGLITLS